MKCLETDRLKEYAYGLMSESPASEVLAHLDECLHCREAVQQHHRLGAVLDEWKVGGPTPEFDARVRMAVDEQRAHSQRWGQRWDLTGWEWIRGLALASLGVLVVAGVAWFSQNHRRGAHLSPVSASVSRPGGGEGMPAKIEAPQSQVQAAQAKIAPVRAGMMRESARPLSDDDRVARALDDYDLAANFDVLSEIPKGESRVAN